MSSTSPSPALGPAALENTELTNVPDLTLKRARSSFAETLDRSLGAPHSTRRQASAFVISFVCSTIIRQLCLSSLVFGKRLAKELAPIERNAYEGMRLLTHAGEVEWIQIALVRVIDLVILNSAWSHSGRSLEGPFLSALLTSISRPPMYSFLAQFFLISSRAMFEVFLTDLAASLASGAIVQFVVGRRTSFRRPPISFFRRLDSNNILSIVLALIVGTTYSGLTNYVFDRLFVHGAVRKAVVDQFIPSYLSGYRPSFAFAIHHPLLPVPTLRSDAAFISMGQALTSSAPLAVAVTLLTLLVLPQSPSRLLALFAAALTGPIATIHLHNLFPLKLWGSAIVGAEISLRAAVVAFIVGFVLTDVRHPAREAILVKPVALIPESAIEKEE